MSWPLDIATILLILAAIFCCLRLLKGPTIQDKITAIDSLALLLLCFSILMAMRMKEPLFVEVGVVVSLFVFITTVAVSRFLQEQHHVDRDK